MATRRELTDAYNRISSRLIRGAGSKASMAFAALGSWRDEDFERFLPFVVGLTNGAALQAVRLQWAYSQQIAQLAGETYTAPVLDPTNYTTSALRNGAVQSEVFRRPFVDVYRALDAGKTMTQAIESGKLRVSSITSTDIQLARRNAGFQSMSANDRVVGFARTLTGAENCALCYVASTQRYHRGDLLPIHPGCDCGIMEIYGTQDPGQIIDEIRLEATHEAVEQRFGESIRAATDYNDIAIREHGELGPLLTVAKQNFTGPGSI